MGVEVFSGDTVRLGFVATTGDATDLNGAKVVASIARNAGGRVLIVKKNQAAGGSDAQLVVTTTAPGRIEGTVFLTAAESKALRNEYDVDLAAHTSDGQDVTFGVSRVTFSARVSAPIV